MNQENTGLDKTVLEKFAAGGTVEFENLSAAQQKRHAHLGIKNKG